MTHYVNQAVRDMATFTNSAGAATDPTALTATVTNPAGTRTVYLYGTNVEVVRDSLGNFHIDVLLSTAGTWVVEWVGTGTAAAASTSVIIAEQPLQQAIVALDDIKAHLNITVATHDSELQGFIDAATPVIEHITGPIIPATYTEYHQGGGPYICLRRVPVVSVTSITEYRPSTAVVLTAAADPSQTVTDSYMVELDTGIVRRYMGSGVAYQFWPGTQTVQAVYTAGYTTVPRNVRMAALDLIEFWWQATRRGRVVTVGPDFDAGGDTLNILGFAVPYKVLGLLEPIQRTPGIA